MQFVDTLRGVQGHHGILLLQDNDMNLMQNFINYFQQLVKIQKTYSDGLLKLVNNLTEKSDIPDLGTQLGQLYSNLMLGTTHHAKQAHDDVEHHTRYTITVLSRLLQQKRNLKKEYQDVAATFEAESEKNRSDISLLRKKYSKSVEKVNALRLRYEEAVKLKVRNGEDMRQAARSAEFSLEQETLKLHNVHNNYVLALHRARLYDSLVYNRMQPALLLSTEKGMRLCIAEIRYLLEQSADHLPMPIEHIQFLNPDTEYQDFISKHNFSSRPPSVIEFDKNLLCDYQGSLQENQLIVNEFTHLQLDKYKIAREQAREFRVTSVKDQDSCIISEKLVISRAEADRNSSRDDLMSHRSSVLSLERDMAITETLAELEHQLIEIVEQAFHKALPDGSSSIPPGLLPVDKPNMNSLINYSGNYQSEASSETSATFFNGFKRSISTTIARARRHGSVSSLRLRSTIKRGKSVAESGSSQTGLDSPVPNTPATPRSAGAASAFSSQQGGGDEANSTASVGNSRAHMEYRQLVTSQSPDLLPAPARIDRKQSYPGVQISETAINDRISPNGTRDVTKERWYHGVLPREEVQRLLQKQGDYLVRQSQKSKSGGSEYKMVLSVFWGDHKHFIIQGNDQSGWHFSEGSFPSIAELLEHYLTNDIAITVKSGVHIRRPVDRADWQLDNDDIQLGPKIGQGNFGEVYRGVYNGQEVAVKLCRADVSQEDVQKKFLQGETTVLNYSHPNIVRLIGIAVQKHPIMIVMEFVPGGSLVKHLRHNRRYLETPALLKMAIDAARGMEYLETRSCIHRDLAARNCLLGRENQIKIADFGMSREEDVYELSSTHNQIPVKWTAPEALNSGRYTSKCDVWSFGVLIWEIFARGEAPYKQFTNAQTKERIENGYRLPPPESTPEAVYKLMLQCWNAESEQRPNFSDIVASLDGIYAEMIEETEHDPLASF